MKPTKIYKTEVDEFSSYARNYILDKKSSEQLRKLYDRWQDVREDVLSTQHRLALIETGHTDTPPGTSLLEDSNKMRTNLNSLCRQEENILKELRIFLAGLPKAPYDRYRLRDNFRNCLEVTGIPLGELEVEGGISRGGFSRWEKTIMTSELPLSFLLTAADRFGVTLKELLYSDVAEKKAVENWAREFIENIKELTEKEEIEWKKCEGDLYTSLVKEGDMNIGYDPGSKDRYLVSLFNYEDFFEDDTPVRDYAIIGDIYCADVPGGQDTVYLFTLKTPDGEDSFMELYIKASEQTAEPLYSTRNGDDGTNDLLKEFAAVITSNVKRTRISQGARQVMDRVARLVNRPSAARFVNRPSVGRFVNGGGCMDEG